MELLKNTWLKLPIEKKTRSYALVLILIILLAGIFNIYVVNDSLQGMGVVLDDLTKCENAFTAFEEQKAALDKLMRSHTEENSKNYDEACVHTRAMIGRLPYRYQTIGAERYARTWRIISAYDVYEEKCNEILDESNESIRSELFYKLLEMQNYQEQYMQDLIQMTVEVGADEYEQKVPLLNRLPYLLLFFSLLALVVTIIFSGVLSTTLTRPIRRLAEHVRQISDNDFSGGDVQVENRDEIGELVTSFNRMQHAMEENRELTDRVHHEEMMRIETEKQLETARLDLLRSQINPHFLFNTLNMISGMAELEDAETTKQMTGSLSHIFRYNLHTTAQFVSLTQELNVIRDYMYLQHMRFGERLKWNIDVEEGIDTDAVSVPAFMLQPLTENAVVHGLSGKESGGSVQIRVYRSEEGLGIEIEDDGVGIPEEKLSAIQLNDVSTISEDHTGIGMLNVYHRITSLVEGGAMRVDSTPEVGTKITITLPEV